MKTRIKQWFLLPALMAGLGLIPAGRVSAQTFTKLFSFTGFTVLHTFTALIKLNRANPG
jgi:hypothetical protein